MIMDIKEILFENRDEKYKKFSQKLIPNLSEEVFIGVRTPQLRKISKNILKDEDLTKSILEKNEFEYYEEKNLFVFLLNELSDFDESTFYLNRFLYFIDNWATCDLISPKAFKLKKNKDRLRDYAKGLIENGGEYKVRLGVKLFLSHLLDDNFKVSDLELISNIKSEYYYVNMVIAWYFCEALIKHYKEAVKIIESKKLGKFTHNKAIQKSVESFRVSDKEKIYLKSLRRK